MSRRQTKTDNSFLETKVRLRLENLPDGEISVLDCYRGSGIIWKTIRQRQPERNIIVMGIDRKSQAGIYLRGDNLKFLKSMDVRKFDVVDLDAYGIPYEQLKTLFSKQTRPGVVVFMTFIQSIFGRLPCRMLRDLGYSYSMVRKCPTLFNRNGFEKLKLWLAMNGVRQIKHFSTNRKHYLCFKIKN